MKKAKTDADIVEEYMSKFKHPLKGEIEEVRTIIKQSNKGVAERIKWNAPSYYYIEDMVTFNHRDEKRVHLIFHHPYIEKMKSPLLEGEGKYKGRRMTYFKDMKEVKAGKKELMRVINELIRLIDG